MLKEIKIEADPSPKTCCNEQCWDNMSSLLVYIIVLVLICVGFGAGLLSLVHWLKSGDQPDTHITFSIVSVSVSELNPNASSLPEFHIVFQAQKAFENCTEMYLYGESTNISYHEINIAYVVDEIDYDYYYYRRNYYDYNCVAPCYNMEDESEFVIPVPLSSSVPGYLRKQLWEQRDIIVLDLEMDFISIWSWYNYHVSCNNVTLGAVDTQIPCNATMM